ncbi:MAG: PhzF family phenazine biosynthesis protein [Ktedonobacteraceae bacterium]
MSLTIYQVDAFTDKLFAGNPAAVCILPQPGDAQWMQQVAMEMNLSETAFLYKQDDGYSLRWFTPAVEVDLCGHATLASAHILWETGHLQANQQARFFTRSGLLTAERKGDWIEMDFPAKLEEQTDAPPNLLQALGISAQQIQYIGKNVFDYLVEVASEDIVRGIQPDFTLLLKVQARGVIVTSRASTPGYDFVSRFFAPLAGVNEDPVTGSAHSCLTPYWSQKLGKQAMVAYQASPRGGILRVRVSGDRVQLSGQAVTVLRGELTG